MKTPFKAPAPFHVPLLMGYPDRRWYLAEQIIETGRHRRRNLDLDEPTRDALDYLIWKRKKNPPFPPSIWVSLVRDTNQLLEPGEQRLRWLLQAYLWTDLSPEEISKATGLGCGIIQTFHDLHYDVDHLKTAGDARITFLLQGRTPDQIPADDEEFYLSFYAIQGGPLALEAVRDYYDHRQEVIQPLQNGVNGSDQRTVELLFIHAAILARSLRLHQQPNFLFHQLLYMVGVLEEAMNLNVKLLQPLRASLQFLAQNGTSQQAEVAQQVQTLLQGLGA